MIRQLVRNVLNIIVHLIINRSNLKRLLVNLVWVAYQPPAGR